MIYTLTLNPALDYVMDAGNIAFGATNRSTSEDISFGGKGINVSVILAELGLGSTALGFVGGFTGEFLAQSLEKQGILADFTRISSGNTRINIKLRNGGEITEVNAAGPNVSHGDLELLYQKLDTLEAGDILVLAGSIPKGVDKNIYAEIMKRLSDRDVLFVVDAAGEILTSTLKYKPFLIKPNLDELCEIVQRNIQSDEDIIYSANILKQMGAQNVLVSMGEKGAILVDEQGTVYRSPSKKITPKNTVGAGDSMVAGFIAGIGRMTYSDALSLGIAAGAATAASDTLATRKQILELL